MDPLAVMSFSFALSLIGSGLMTFLAERSFLWLQVLSGISGFGMASIYATGNLTWSIQIEFLKQLLPRRRSLARAIHRREQPHRRLLHRLRLPRSGRFPHCHRPVH